MSRTRLLKFGSKTCAACAAMDKAKTLTRFQEAFPQVIVQSVDVSDENSESPSADESSDGVDYEANYKLSDEYLVQSLPTLIFEVEGAGEIARIEGAASLKDLKEMFTEITDMRSRAEKLPWASK